MPSKDTTVNAVRRSEQFVLSKGISVEIDMPVEGIQS